MWSAAALLPLFATTHKPLSLLSLSKLKQLVQKEEEP
jgi:hypothetical protein